MAAAVAHNMAEGFGNAGISLILDGNGVVRCLITPETAQYLLGVPFADPFACLALVDEENEDGDPNVEVFAARLLERLRHEAGEEEAQEGMPMKGSRGRGARCCLFRKPFTILNHEVRNTLSLGFHRICAAAKPGFQKKDLSCVGK
jgi:hypothetical protein